MLTFFIENNAFVTSHQLTNVYTKAVKRYEVRIDWKNRSMLLQQMNRRMSPISPFGLFLPYIGYQ